jgi:flagellar motor switch protein FliN
MAENKAATSLQLVAEPFRQALADALTQIAQSWKVTISADDAPASTDAAPLCFGITAAGALKGIAVFELKTADAILFAQKLLSETAESTAELSANHKQAIEEFLRKVVAAAAASLKNQFGEFTLELSAVDPPSWRGATATFQASEGSATISFKLQFDSDFLSGLRAPAADAPAAASAPSAPAKPPSTGDSHLDLLLGVDLNLTLRFGQRTLTLREILELTSGSIIELDRQVQEPADLLLGDKLIARGEVVIVDGNYGLRITEVAEQQGGAERMVAAAAQ